MAANAKMIALNTGLAAGLVLVVWQGRVKWQEAQAERRANVNVPVKKVTPPPMTPVQKPDAVQAAKYADVAAKNLFSKDRNPTVVVDPPKVDAPKMPALPVVYGVFGFPSGVKAMMADHPGGQSKSVHTGDSVGEFKVVTLDLRKITLEWNGKQMEHNLDDLADHSEKRAAAAPAAPAGAGSGPALPAAPQSAPSAAPTAATALGAETGTPDAPTRSCKSGDTSPVGTIVDGFKKTGTATPFGVMNCNWVQSK